MHQFAHKLNDYINWRKTAELLIASLPGAIFAYKFNDQFWFSASLIAVCAIIPIGTSHQNFFLALLHASYIFAMSILLYYNSEQWLLYLFILTMMGLIFAVVETDNPHFKDVSTWTFISVIYISIRLHGRYNFNAGHLGGLYLLILLSIFASIISFARYDRISIHPIVIHHSKILHYFKYFPPLILSILVWKIYNPPEVEWFIWASLSVLNIDYLEARTKMEQRLWGGGFGIALGLLIMPLLPKLAILNYVFYVLILVSFRLFYKYLHCYIFRCFLIVLFSGVEFQSMGKIRIMSILIGGMLGLACSWLISHGDSYLKRHYCRHSATR